MTSAPVRLLRWLLAPSPGQVPRTVPLLIVAGLAVTATVGQAIAYPHADTTEEFAAGANLILGVNALIGLVASLTFNPFGMLGGASGSDEALSAAETGIRVWPMLGLAIAVQVVAGIPITIAFSSGPWTSVFSPLLFGGVLPLIAMLLAWLAGMLVLWPLIQLIGMGWRLLTGRAASLIVTAYSVFFLTLSAFAITAAFGTDYSDRGERGGIRTLVRLFTDQTADPSTLAFRWVARCLCVIMVIEFVWFLIASARGRRRQRTAAR